jgi:ATP-dependent DNA helicase RecG
MGINDSAIQAHFDKLKRKGVLKHIGPARGGYWEVIKK